LSGSFPASRRTFSLGAGMLLAEVPTGPFPAATGDCKCAADFVSGLPQSLQNRAASSFSCPQKLQVVFTA
jgi:hypothetical protein